MSRKRTLIVLSMVLPLLAAAALLGALTALAAPNATITVTNTNDSGAGSLRRAVTDANSGDTINFAAGLGGEIITLIGELSIDKSLTISGSKLGWPITVSGRNTARVFNVTTGNVTFDSLTIANGNVQTWDCGGDHAQCGGGIMIQNSGVAVTVTNSTLSSNAASYGGGIYNNGTLTVINSTLSSNAADYGGGIYNNGTSTVSNSTLHHNGVDVQDGGGIYNGDFGTLTVSNSTLYSNGVDVQDGGGIYNNGTLTVSNSTLDDNGAYSYYGGEIYSNGTLTVSNSTLARGGIRHNLGTFYMRNTILFYCYSSGLVSATANLIRQNYGCGTPVSSGSFRLGKLQNNGGDTWTHALLPGSPAIDAGDTPTCLAADQRGIARPQNTSCDIGAFESRGFTLSLSGGTPQTTGINTAFAIPLALTVSSASGEQVEGGQVTFSAPGSGAGLTFTETVVVFDWHGTPYLAVTANGTVGSYQVFANTSGNSGSAITYDLTNVLAAYMLTVQLDGGVEYGDGSGSVSSTPPGIDCPPDCSETYYDEAVVTLTATANTGSTFTRWGGVCGGTAACLVQMVADKTVTAIFKLDAHELTVSRAGTGSGSVSSTPAGIDCGTDCSEIYSDGTVVTLTATADTGSTFTGWGGACSGTAGCEVTMVAAKTVTATFTQGTHAYYLPILIK